MIFARFLRFFGFLLAEAALVVIIAILQQFTWGGFVVTVGFLLFFVYAAANGL